MKFSVEPQYLKKISGIKLVEMEARREVPAHSVCVPWDFNLLISSHNSLWGISEKDWGFSGLLEESKSFIRGKVSLISLKRSVSLNPLYKQSLLPPP